MRGRTPAAVSDIQLHQTSARALHTFEAMLKPTEWERISDQERGQLLAHFPQLAERATRGEPLLRARAPEAIQTWIGGIVGPTLQPHLVAAIRQWLATAAETAHLFIGGSNYQGTPQLAVAVARHASANWQIPQGFCYAPDPVDLTNPPALLRLPLGTSPVFAEQLGTTLIAIGKQWDNTETRQAFITQAFAGLVADASAPAQEYLRQLGAALIKLASAGADFPYDEDNAPPLRAVAYEPEAKGQAPVVDASNASDDLEKLLLQANGGVLIVSNTVNLGELGTALVAREIATEDGWPKIPLDLRVIFVGGSDDYDAVSGVLFRYEAWTRDLVAWNRHTEVAYAAFVTGVAQYYGLPTPEVGAIARVIQEGARRADSINRQRLVTNLLLAHDLVIEAGKFARSRHLTTIPADAVDAILEHRAAIQRPNIDLVQEAILTGENIIPTDGATIGQINGLGILATHPFEAIFAIPTRISATVAPGKGEQVLDIEREAGQTDESHVRGLLTMEGYFINQYGQDFALNLAARIRFEQEQNSMGGDSASAAELFALLSALAKIPIRRSYAVTGAVGQYGEIQPIGGVNFKIEGFWDLCRRRRQMNEQVPGGYGVLIPAANARDLMLRPAVAASIATEGWFQIWAISTVDEALPLLMGAPAAKVHQLVEQRLRQFAALITLQKRR